MLPNKNIDYYRIISLVHEIEGGKYISAKTVDRDVVKFARATKAEIDLDKLEESRKVWNKIPKPSHFAYK